MGYETEQSKDGERGTEVQIVVEQVERISRKLTDKWGSTLFEPQREVLEPAERDDANPAGMSGGDSNRAPEKKLTLFALQLAILEKAASGLGALGFIWATVVLLGGFAITLETKDFWFVTVILLIEGTRIFSRSRELEWQHQATWSIADAGRSSFRALRSSCRAIKLIFQPLAVVKPGNHQSRRLEGDIQKVAESRPPEVAARRTWHTSEVPLLPVAGWVFLSRNISRVLYWLQLLSALACVSLSLMRIVEQDFGEVRREDTEKKNRQSALNIFYGLALAEALLFLMEKAYWEWKVSYLRLLEHVNRECDLGPLGMVSIKRFFYDAYSRSINGSIFDGLKMDLVSFAHELLASSSHDEQLIGARILLRFATNPRFADETLRKIGTSTPVIERLVEMLNWKNPAEEEIRKSAAQIVSKLAGKKQNALRVAGIAGAMESISSLLYTGRGSNERPDEISHRRIIADGTDNEFSAFNLLGLLILKKLAHDHDNCGKIGNTRGLLAKIIDFTSATERLLRSEGMTESQIAAVKRSLQVVKHLVSTTGHTGKMLRQEISEIVFTVSNIREILKYGENHMTLQKLGIEILTSLAMDEDVRERIGNTGGVIKELLHVFFKAGCSEAQKSVSVEAGEALAMLALENKSNCVRILKEEGVVELLVSALQNPVLRINSSRILHKLCAYTDTDFFSRVLAVTDAIPTVLNAVMVEEMKLLEVSIGLITQIFRLISHERCAQELEKAGIKEANFIEKLVAILKTYDCPSIKVPRIRRFVIELAILLMKSNKKNIHLFTDYGMEKELRFVEETTTELECFHVFSGSAGLSRHNTTLCCLIDTALELMNEV